MNEIIKQLISKCDLGILMEEPKRIEGGLLNKMFKISTNKGVYVLKALNPEIMSREDGKKKCYFYRKSFKYS